MEFVYYLKTLPEFKDGEKLNDSALKILEALVQNKKPLSTKELVGICNISSRMIQYNLERLLNNQPPLVKQAPDLRDLRKKQYTINPELYNRANQFKNSVNFTTRFTK